MKHYAGIDLSMETSHVCVVDADGRKIDALCVDSTPETIAAALERYGPVERAVIETGRMTPSIALGLRELGVTIVCIDARQAHQSLKAMRANKTDPHDAAGLAQLARTGFYKEVHVKSPAAHGVRGRYRARASRRSARPARQHHPRPLRHLRDQAGDRPGRAVPCADARGRRHPWARRSGGVAARCARAIGRRDQAAGSQLKAISTASPACQALMSIPGVGVQTSAAFAAAIDDAVRFKRSRTAGAYFGLVPRRHQSGELDWTGRITKQGDSTVRKLLYEAANSILTRTRQTFALKTWALKIAKRRGLRKARVALARRLAVIMHAMLRDGTLFEA
jgi:transposase